MILAPRLVVELAGPGTPRWALEASALGSAPWEDEEEKEMALPLGARAGMC